MYTLSSGSRLQHIEPDAVPVIADRGSPRPDVINTIIFNMMRLTTQLKTNEGN